MREKEDDHDVVVEPRHVAASVEERARPASATEEPLSAAEDRKRKLAMAFPPVPRQFFPSLAAAKTAQREREVRVVPAGSGLG